MAEAKSTVTLDDDQLNEIDNWILDFLADHEWATVNLMRSFYVADEGSVSRQWIANRVGRLTEHGHLAKVRSTRTYELVDDPRDHEQGQEEH